MKPYHDDIFAPQDVALLENLVVTERAVDFAILDTAPSKEDADELALAVLYVCESNEAGLPFMQACFNREIIAGAKMHDMTRHADRRKNSSSPTTRASRLPT
eukprot:TRINITY_DN11767_c0_g1_i1.p1 TRINITY_DN11767_c0_g1~~TRINITY_DN11767_c0_g1_i1.p1  ORF type:complete len:102 (-),score=21.07 TRINITY_DN11767_c0_g1_i1:217-522(-)